MPMVVPQRRRAMPSTLQIPALPIHTTLLPLLLILSLFMSWIFWQERSMINSDLLAVSSMSSKSQDLSSELIQQRQRIREQIKWKEMQDRKRLRAASDSFIPLDQDPEEYHMEQTPQQGNPAPQGEKESDETWEEPPYFDFLQPPIPNNDTLPKPRPTTESLVVLILSHRSHVNQRSMIRQTWGKNHSIVFCIGGSEAILYARNHTNQQGEDSLALQKHLLQEANTHQDMLDSIHPDTYRSLPYKLRYGYQWILSSNPKAQWILKTDDDFFARPSTLEQVALRPLNSLQPIVVGKIMQDTPIHRTGKWAELLYRPSNRETYPFWPQGSQGHVVSRPIAHYIANLSNVTYYQGEDTSLGIWIEHWEDVIYVNSPYFTNHGRCNDTDALVIGHDVHHSALQECYQHMDEWGEDNWSQKNVQYLYVETHKQRYSAWEDEE